MSAITPIHDLTVTTRNGTLSVEGSLSRSNGPDWLAWSREQPAPKFLELDTLDIEDGLGVVYAVDAIRDWLERGASLDIHGAPQLLAHTLYRCGLLQSGSITLHEPREEEPYG